MLNIKNDNKSDIPNKNTIELNQFFLIKFYRNFQAGLGFKLTGTAVHTSATMPMRRAVFARVIRDRELRRRDRRGGAVERAKGDILCSISLGRARSPKRRNRRRMTKVTARCQNTCPFLFLRSERPAAPSARRYAICISMHRGGRSCYSCYSHA